MKRWNVVYFFDGTNADRHRTETRDWSNIVRLYMMVPPNAPGGVEQWKPDEDGVGTRVNETILGSSGGVGLEKRVEESYLHLGSVCRKAKKEGATPFVYVFGFSRGAYAARWFTALVDYCGIPANAAPYDRIKKCFKDKDEGCLSQLRRDGLIGDAPEFSMLGLFDAVQSTIFKGDFDVHILPRIVKRCYHAMAFNERRPYFPVERFVRDPERITEAWFLGSHTDIGGGYVERGLADRSLEWMVENARDCGLFVNDGPIVGDMAVHRDSFHNSLTIGWRIAGWLCARKAKDRELESGDKFHWDARDLRPMFADVRPALPPEEEMAYLDRRAGANLARA